jgi:hypothetical protein
MTWTGTGHTRWGSDSRECMGSGLGYEATVTNDGGTTFTAQKAVIHTRFEVRPQVRSYRETNYIIRVCEWMHF